MALQDLLNAIQTKAGTPEAGKKTIKTTPSELIETSRTVKTPYESRTFKSPKAEEMDKQQRLGEKIAGKKAEEALPSFTTDEQNLFTTFATMKKKLVRIKDIIPDLPQYNAPGVISEAGTKYETFIRVNPKLKPSMDEIMSMKSGFTRLSEKGVLTEGDVKRNAGLLETIATGNPEEKVIAYNKLAGFMEDLSDGMVEGVRERAEATKALQSGKSFKTLRLPRIESKTPGNSTEDILKKYGL